MTDLLLFILAAPVVAAASIIWLIALMRSLVWLAERLDSRLDSPQRVEVHHYHHTAQAAPPVTIDHAPLTHRTVAYPVAAREPQRITRR